MIHTKIIESLMQQHKLSLSKLSLSIGIQKSTLSRILSGETTNPNPETIRSIANYFSVPVSELLIDEEIGPKVSLKGGTLTNNLRTLMLNASIFTAKDLNRATGIPTSNIERILNGTTSNPHLGTLNELANYFNIDIAQLRGDEPLHDIFKGQVNPLFCNVPLLSINDVTTFMNGNISQERTFKFVKASKKIMGKKSFAITINNDNYINDFKKNYILVVDSDTNPDNSDYVIASVRENPPSIYEFFYDNTVLLREAGKEDYTALDVTCVAIYGVVIEIKLKENSCS